MEEDMTFTLYTVELHSYLNLTLASLFDFSVTNGMTDNEKSWLGLGFLFVLFVLIATDKIPLTTAFIIQNGH